MGVSPSAEDIPPRTSERGTVDFSDNEEQSYVPIIFSHSHFTPPPHLHLGQESIGVACLVCGELCGGRGMGSADRDGGKIYMRGDGRGVWG